jgi:uncharacterized repeat protein (TIGR03803 family)
MGACKKFAILCSVWGCLLGVANAGPAVPTTVYSFCADVACVNGAFVYPDGAAALVQATDGGLYGTTYAGGSYGAGSIYGISPSGVPITLYSFCASSGCPDGSNPYFGLTLAPNGEVYGVTKSGGANNAGTVFEITPSSLALTTLFSFCSTDTCDQTSGSLPDAALVLASNGDLYGSTVNGGTSGKGTIFKITPSGTLTTLYNFTGLLDGSGPQAALVQFTDGDLYGTTSGAGLNGHGTIFKVTPVGGKLTTLYSFSSPDCCASAALLAGTNGNFYGTSKFGGSSGKGAIYELTPSGQLTTLYSFSGADGTSPNSALIQATDGNIYGTTEGGGTSGAGTIFKMTLVGGLTTLYEFGSSYAGMTNSIYAGLFQATDGNLYGTTEIGGAAHDGTIFRLSTGLGPFIDTLPRIGRAGDVIKILGYLVGASTSVTFNGSAASFTVISGTEIETTVPAGATTGMVEVATPGGMLLSHLPFTVTPTPTVPSYDGSELTVPLLEIDNATYTDVVVTPLAILSVAMGNPIGNANIYYPANNQMTLPSVTYQGKTYTNVVITIGKLISIGNESGADIYSNAVLVIPSVQVLGGAVYTNVRITVADIISAGGGMPRSVHDVYDPATRQLTIAAVLYSGKVYTNAIVAVGDVIAP